MGGLFGGALDGGIESRRGGEGEAKDAAAMVIFDERINGGFAGAGADREDAELAREWHEAFEDERRFGLGRIARAGSSGSSFLRARRLRRCAGAIGLCRHSPCGRFSAWRAGRFSSRRRRALRGCATGANSVVGMPNS